MLAALRPAILAAVATLATTLPVVKRADARAILRILPLFALAFRRLALLIAVAAILTFGLPAIVAAFRMVALLLAAILTAILVAVAAKLRLGLRPIGGVLLLTAVLAAPVILASIILAAFVLASVLLTAILLPAILTITVAARRVALDLLVGRETVRAFATALFLGLAATIILAIVAAFGTGAPVRVAALLLRRLLLSRRDDAVIVLGMLQIALGNDPVA